MAPQKLGIEGRKERKEAEGMGMERESKGVTGVCGR